MIVSVKVLKQLSSAALIFPLGHRNIIALLQLPASSAVGCSALLQENVHNMSNASHAYMLRLTI